MGACRGSKGVFALALVVIISCATFGSLLLSQDNAWMYLPAPASRMLQEAPEQLATTAPPQGKGTDSGCEPRDHVFFLKTHKCGSSTVQNILMRRGLARGLNFVLPEKANYLGHPELFVPEKHVGKALRPPPGTDFDIFTHHSRFNPENVRRAMPSDTKRVTILREPASLFESLYNYYDLTHLYDAQSLLELLQLPVSSVRDIFEQKPRFAYRIGHNQMSFDLGMPKEKFNEPAAVQQLIATMEREFHLVMLSEYMEVSLILFAELMCWPLEEVTFVKLNARPDKFRAELSPENVQKLHQLNPADTAIYSYFKEQFKSRVVAYGMRRMERDLGRLLHLNQEAFRECVQVEVQPKENANQYPVIRYKVRPSAPHRCSFLIMNELEFTDYLRKQQSTRVAAIKRLQDFMR